MNKIRNVKLDKNMNIIIKARYFKVYLTPLRHVNYVELDRVITPTYKGNKLDIDVYRQVVHEFKEYWDSPYIQIDESLPSSLSAHADYSGKLKINYVLEYLYSKYYNTIDDLSSNDYLIYHKGFIDKKRSIRESYISRILDLLNTFTDTYNARDNEISP